MKLRSLFLGFMVGPLLVASCSQDYTLKPNNDSGVGAKDGSDEDNGEDLGSENSDDDNGGSPNQVGDQGGGQPSGVKPPSLNDGGTPGAVYTHVDQDDDEDEDDRDEHGHRGHRGHGRGHDDDHGHRGHGGHGGHRGHGDRGHGGSCRELIAICHFNGKLQITMLVTAAVAASHVGVHLDDHFGACGSPTPLAQEARYRNCDNRCNSR